jgi:Mg-chelatase subunit ChlD
MGAPATHRRPDRETFARSLNRASAKRGALDIVYKDLSDHWTLLMQQLYPVWLVIGPGLSHPGHIELESRTVYLDSEELLGARETILSGTLDRYQVLVCFGVAFHEVMHAKHTKRWVCERLKRLDDEGQETLARDLLLLEEPRMEAHGVRDYPDNSARGRFVRRALSATVTSVLLPRFEAEVLEASAAGQPLTREVCGRAMTYLAARTHYGIVDPATLGALTPIWDGVLGVADVRALHDLYARVIWAPDGDVGAMDGYAAEYRAIIGPPDPPLPSAGQQAAGTGAGSPSGDQGDSGDGAPNGGGDGGDKNQAADGDQGEGGGAGGKQPQDGQGMKSLADAVRNAQQRAHRAQVQQLNEDVSLDDVLARAERTPEPLATGGGTGAPTGRMPDRGVNRPPFPDEVQAAARFANRLEQARTVAVTRIPKRTPGGRFNARNHIRAMAQRQHGRPITAYPWSLERIVRNPIQEPHVGFIVDTSGSMAGYEYALGPIVWIIDTALRTMGGRMATGLFGNGASLLSDGSRPLALVPEIRTGGGTAFAGDAIVMCCEHLEMENRSRPRFLYVLSDGGWYDTEAGVERIEWLAGLGVPTIHISIGCEPLSVQADRISVISDPADALQIVADDTVGALLGGGRMR